MTNGRPVFRSVPDIGAAGEVFFGNQAGSFDKMLPLARAGTACGVVGDGKGQASPGSGGFGTFAEKVITRLVIVYRGRSLIFSAKFP